MWKPPAEFFARQPRLKALFSLGAGVDSLLAIPTLPRDVPLVRMDDAGMADQMVEYALYVALREFRRMPEYEAAQAAGRWAPVFAQSLADRRVLLLGYGGVGKAVAARLVPFEVELTAVASRARDEDGVAVHGIDELPELLPAPRS